MSDKTVTISMEEYQKLKRLEEINTELIEQLIKSLEDVKKGRIKRVA